LSVKSKNQQQQQQQQLPHWLDYSEEKFGRPLINDIKSVLKILLLFVPLPLFWSLFDQQGSRWTFQATRMNGNLGFIDIKPDQMQVVNPLLILIFIPIFDCAIYPFLSKLGLKRPLQKLAAGGILAAVAFAVSGIVEIQLEQTYPVLPKPNESQVRIFNGFSCNYSLSSDIVGINTQQLNSLDINDFNVKLDSTMKKSFKFDPLTPECPRGAVENLTLSPGKSNSFYIMNNNSSSFEVISFEDKIEKSKSGDPIVRVLANSKLTKQILFLNEKGQKIKHISSSSREQFEIIPSIYTVFADDFKLGEVDLLLGGVYTIIISNVSNGNIDFKSHLITPPNSIHMVS
jgi:solute carrier family 15 (oligopeptide transporter), member 1